MSMNWLDVQARPRAFAALLTVLRRLLATIGLLLSALCRLPVAIRLARSGLRRWCHDRTPLERSGCCLHLPQAVHKRADPLLYSQSYLMAKGLAVTWDNPDIQLYRDGVLVAPGALAADTEYDVVVRVWNGSYDAPAPGLPVLLSFLSFGIGTTSTAVGKTSVDLGVKGSSAHPAFAHFTWRTPATPGHYCLQALLDWPDDANPDNNLGQKNTQVGAAHSPAHFSFVVRNRASVARAFRFEVDTYDLPVLAQCAEAPRGAPPASRYDESRARWARALAAQKYGGFPVPDDWKIALSPDRFELPAGGERTVEVAIEPMRPDWKGERAFNVHGFADGPHRPELVGGVTLQVVRE